MPSGPQSCLIYIEKGIRVTIYSLTGARGQPGYFLSRIRMFQFLFLLEGLHKSVFN